MSRVVLIHWNQAEAEERAERLRRTGHEVDIHADQDSTGLRAVRDNPPHALVIDLGRLPSHGRMTAIWLRQQKATRHVPIVFVAGAPEKVARVRESLPDAAFTEWSRIRGVLRQAIRKAPADPVVPGTPHFYSGTPLPRKLGIKAGTIVAMLGAPQGFERLLRPLPDEVRLVRQARATPGLILLFVKSRSELRRRFPVAARALAEGGSIWIVWPKRASGVATDLDQAAVRAFGLDAGFVDYKVCAVDQTWSGLWFARRRAAGVRAAR
jgi:CheY-like chemotaxis protein